MDNWKENRNELGGLVNTWEPTGVSGRTGLVRAPFSATTQSGDAQSGETGGAVTPAGGLKYDSGKPRMELLPAVALEEIAAVLTFGANKYQAHNWQKGIAYSRLLGATFRHLCAFLRGEDRDPESGLSHLAHAGCCVVFLLWMNRYRQDLDDRAVDPVPRGRED